MAFPSIASVTKADSGANVTSLNVAYPASVATGDLLLAFVAFDGAGDTVSSPNFTAITNGNARANTPADNGAGYWFYRIASGAHGGNETFTITGGTEWMVGAMFRIAAANWHGTTPPEAANFPGAASSVNPNPPNLVPSWGAADTLWIAAAAADGNQSAGTPTYPTNYGLNQDAIRPSNTGAFSIYYAARQLSAASEDPGTFTIASSDQWAAFTVAVRPAGGGSPTTLTPDPVTVGTAVPAPTISKALTLTPAPVATSTAVPAPTVTKALTLTPSPVAVGTAVPAPTLDQGGAGTDLTPDPVVAVTAVPAPAIALALVIVSAPVVASTAVPAPALSSALGLAPSPVAAQTAVPAPEVTKALSVAPDPIPVALAVPEPTVTKALILTPDPVAVVTTVPEPTIDAPGAPIDLAPDPVAVVLTVPSPTLVVEQPSDQPTGTGGGGGYGRQLGGLGQRDGLELDDESVLLLLLLSAP